METRSIGIREFRARLADYLLKGDKPITVTRHGSTVGYFIPVRASRSQADRVALREAAAHVDAMLKQAGFSEKDMEEVARDLRAWRKKRRK